ncbi:MAG: protein-(glutamine-N5) methyltransferase, release factor-specific [Rickettsiales bacterium]|nr:protein-(glutamine-N5) methyltransferase, release factor-specific [Rickettsiales bacterium]
MAGTLSVGEILKKSSQWLEQRGSSSARLDAELLLAEVLELERIKLYTSFERPLSSAEQDSYRALVKRRGEGEPVAYILGSREFYSRDFTVDRRVLIPRPDTEVLVDTTLELLPELEQDAVVLDYGTGSGAIAVTLAAERPELRLLAIDLSAEALDVARLNAARHGVKERLGFVQSDGLSRVPERFEGKLCAIVANPPYLSEQDRTTMTRDVLEFEPHSALFPGADPLLHYRRLAKEGPRWLRADGLLTLEVGHLQAGQVCELLEATGWGAIQVRSDLARTDRVVSARRPS